MIGVARDNAGSLQASPELLDDCLLYDLNGDMMEQGRTGPKIIGRECAGVIEEGKERSVPDLKEEMAIFLLVVTRITVVQDNREDQRQAKDVLVKMPRRLRVSAAEGDMVDPPQLGSRAILSSMQPVLISELDIGEMTPHGVLILNDILTLRHKSAVHAVESTASNNWPTSATAAEAPQFIGAARSCNLYFGDEGRVSEVGGCVTFVAADCDRLEHLPPSADLKASNHRMDVIS